MIPFAFVKQEASNYSLIGIGRYNLKVDQTKAVNFREEFNLNDTDTFNTSSNNICMKPTLDLFENKPEGNLI